MKQTDNTATQASGTGAHSGNAECIPLLTVCTSRLYRENSFRVLGLPVDARATAIKSAANKLSLKLANEGADSLGQTHAYALVPPPTEELIQRANGLLMKVPERRLIDEFFWFWPEGDKSADDPAIQSLLEGDAGNALNRWAEQEADPDHGYVAKHNIAVLFHLSALDWTLHHLEYGVEDEREEKIQGYWRDAFSRWEELVVDERLWDHVRARIGTLAEPELKPAFAHRMKAVLPDALDKINAEVAIDFARHGKWGWARWHVGFMRETNVGLANIERTAALVLRPMRERFLKLMESARTTAQKDFRQTPDQVQQLIEQCEPWVYLFDLLHGRESHERSELFDDLARTCNIMLCEYENKAKDSGTFVNLLRRVLPFATSTELQQRIQQNINLAEGDLRASIFAPIYDQLEKIQKGKEPATSRFASIKKDVLAPLPKLLSLAGPDEKASQEACNSCAIVLRGICLQAGNDENNHALAKEILRVATGLTFDQELRRKLADDLETLDAFLGEGVCHFCGQQPAVTTQKYSIPMHQITEQLPGGVRYTTSVAQVPRCPHCAAIHGDYWTWSAWGAFAGTLLGPLFGPYAVAAGCVVVGCLLAAFCVLAIIRSSANGNLGLLAIFFALGGLGVASGVLEERATSGLLILQMAGGAITLGSAALVVRLATRKGPSKTADAHPRVRKLMAQGFRMGAKPQGYK